MTIDETPADALVQPAPPEIDDTTAAQIALDGWGVVARARALGSHQDRNFRLDRDAAPPLLLKIANPSVTAAELEAQSAAAELIAAGGTLRAPRALAHRDGGTTRHVVVDGISMQARILEFLEGETLSGSGYLSPTVVRAMGAAAATVDVQLTGLRAEGAERAHQWDLRHTPGVLAELLPYVHDDTLRERLSDASAAAWQSVDAWAPQLPRQFIHGDLTDDNVITADRATHVPDAVIDLGDLNRTWTIGELAITLSSLLHHDGVGLAEAVRAVSAYHAVRPLSADEAAVLWPLVVLRGAVLVASAHHVLATDAANLYALENLAHERAIFEAAVSVPLDVATALVRSAVGLAVDAVAVPEGRPLFPALRGAAVVDLSPTSPLLHEGRWLTASIEEDLFADALSTAPAAVARFGESRLTRSRLDDQTEPRNVALGVEVRLAEPQAIAAPWAGTVTPMPWGVLLQSGDHWLRVEGCRCTLGSASDVGAGDVIGQADSRVWIQLVRDGIAAPDFAARSLSRVWRAVVGDPSGLVPGHPSMPATAASDALMARRDAAFADVQEHYFAEPPVIVRGWREHLIDADGRVYLDTLNNVTSVGHAHPRLVDAVAEQWRLLNTNSRFHYPAVVEFSERLAALLPDPLDTVFLVNSGSEAVDLALRLAQAWSGRKDVVAIREAYHGWTYLTDAVSTSIADNPAALETRPGWVHTVEAPLPHRGGAAGVEHHVERAVAEIERLAAAGTPPGAFLAESVFGNAGGVPLPDGYLDAVYRAVRRHGGLAIADEVQVGYGRLGEWFWGFEQQGVVPDVVAVAKSMGSGHPLGAVVTTRAIAEAYRAGGYFFSSAGGSPVSSVVGLTVLDIIRDEGLQQNARATGAYLKSRLETLAQRHPLIGAVHGSGFYLGPEFVRDHRTWEPATRETAAICDRLRELGVIAQPTGDHQNILKVKPPLCFSRRSADVFVHALDRVLTTGW